jgi:hypothetical protein
MSMRKTVVLAALLGLVGIGCLEQPPAATTTTTTTLPPLAFTVNNLGVTGWSWFLHGDGFVAFLQREDAEVADLNGDGDQSDFVPAVWDAGTGAVTSTGLAIPNAPWQRPDWFRILDDDVVAIGVSEAGQGGVDRNGDGDTLDAVLHVWDRSTTSPTNLGVALEAGTSMWGSDGAVLAWISEAKQGADLNGDGDTSDRVQHAWTATNGLVSLGLPSGWGNVVPGDAGRFLIDVQPTPGSSAVERYAVYDAVADTLDVSDLELVPGFGFAQAASAGNLAVAGTEYGYSPSSMNRDLNGDGDQTDTVLHIWSADGTRTNVGVAVHWAHIWSLGDGGFLLAVPEANQANTDLNGDGDTTDRVAHVWTPAGGLQNLGVNLPFSGTSSVAVLAGSGAAALNVSESEQGGTDLNGDGDALDEVAHIWSAGGGLVNTALALAGAPSAGAGGIGLAVAEWSQGGTDRNGDGDTSDVVAHAWSPTLGVVNLGMAAGDPPAAAGSFVGFATAESSNGGTDLNGDGDAVDQLPYAWDPVLGGLSQILALDSAFVADSGTAPNRWAASSRISVLVPEGTNGLDLNGDGDTSDVVVHIVESNR